MLKRRKKKKEKKMNNNQNKTCSVQPADNKAVISDNIVVDEKNKMISF